MSRFIPSARWMPRPQIRNYLGFALQRRHWAFAKSLRSSLEETLEKKVQGWHHQILLECKKAADANQTSAEIVLLSPTQSNSSTTTTTTPTLGRNYASYEMRSELMSRLEEEFGSDSVISLVQHAQDCKQGHQGQTLPVMCWSTALYEVGPSVPCAIVGVSVVFKPTAWK